MAEVVVRRVSQRRVKVTILVVEDDDDLRSLLAEHFEDAGYRVETAVDGNEATAYSTAVLEQVVEDVLGESEPEGEPEASDAS